MTRHRAVSRRPVALLAAAVALGILTGIPGAIQPANAALVGPGSPDTTLDADGQVANDLLVSLEEVVGVDTDSQRRVVMAVNHATVDQSVYVSRYTTDGALDDTFQNPSGQGDLEVDLSGLGGEIQTVDVAVDSLNRVVIAGTQVVSPVLHNVVVVRLREDGQLDTTFNGDGVSVVNFDGANSEPRAISIDNVNRTVVAGAESDSVRMLRLDEAGGLDSSFGVDAGVADPGGPPGFSRYLELVHGFDEDNGSYIAAVGTTPTGVLVHMYDEDGFRFAPGLSPPNGVYPETGIAAGAVSWGDNLIITIDTGDLSGKIMSLNSDGGLTSGFGTGGVRTFSNFSTGELAFRGGDTIYAAGMSFDGANWNATIRAIDANDGSDNTGVGVGGLTLFPVGGTPYSFQGGQGRSIAIDGARRPIIAFGDQSNSQFARATALTPPDPISGTKVFFSEYGSLFAMNDFGQGVVSLGTPPAGFVYTQPMATFGGDLIFERSETGPPFGRKIMRADASDGGNVRIISNDFYPGLNASTPSVSESGDSGFVGFIVNGCAKRDDIAPGGFFTNGPCSVNDFDLHPYNAEDFLVVQNGDLFLGQFGSLTQLTQLTDLGNVEEAKWGLDGTIAAIVYNGTAPRSHLATIPVPAYAAQPQDLQTLNPVLNAGNNVIRSFAPSPDLANPRIAIEYSNNSIVMADIYDNGDNTFTTLRPGTLFTVGNWTRNFSAYPLGEINLEPSAVPASAVPTQSGSPDVMDANPNINSAGLIKLNLLKSPLLKLNLLSSPLLKLNLLSSALLKLNLLKSPIGLDVMGVATDLGGSPKVREGLDRISAATMPILDSVDEDNVDRGGWRERIAAVGTPAALELSRLSLTQISLGDMLRLSPQPAFPGLGQIDLTQSAFGGLSSLPFVLGNTRLSQISGVDWCAVFDALPGDDAADCGAAYGVPGNTADRGKSASLLSLQISGVNLDGLTGVDLSAITYGQLNLDAASSLMPNIILSTVKPNLRAATVGGIKVFGLPAGVVNCDTPATFDCGETAGKNLADAQAAGKLRADATLDDLGSAADLVPAHELALGLLGSPLDDPYDKSQAALRITPAMSSQLGSAFGISYARLGTGPGVTSNPTVTATLPLGFTYQAGTSTVSGLGIPDPAEDDAGTLTWDVPTDVEQGDVMNLTFRAFAVNPPEVDPEELINHTLSATISDGTFVQAVGSDPVFATDRFENGDVNCGNDALAPDTLYFSRLEPRGEGESPDIDRFCITAPAAHSKLTIYLNQLEYDADLAVFHPEESSGPSTALRPVADIPLIKPVGDKTGQVYNGGEPLISDGEADVPIPGGAIVAGISNNRGTKAERVEVITWPTVSEGNQYEFQVSGFNGAGGTAPYALRYTIEAPLALVHETPRSFSHSASPGPAPLPTNLDGIILTAPGRLADMYGAPAANAVAAKVAELAAATNSAVFPVDSNGTVLQKYGFADDAPGDPDVHNAVVRAINDAVDTYLGARRGEVENVIVVGTDDVIPFARLSDLTQTANERMFSQELLESGASGASALVGAAFASRILSDDPYGSFTPRPFGGTHLYVPDVAIGRLVETPEQIQAVITEFVTPVPGDGVGVLRPDKTLSAGHDFMTKLAESIRDTFDAQITGATDISLIDETWDRSDITNAVAGGGDAPDLIALNAHYSPTFFGPAARFDTDFPGAPNVGASALAVAADLRRRLFLTMGCHSGYSITNYLAGTDPADWPEATAGDAIGAFVGNTGYGLGLRDVNAFSQTLFDDFATFTANGSLGGALDGGQEGVLGQRCHQPVRLQGDSAGRVLRHPAVPDRRRHAAATGAGRPRADHGPGDGFAGRQHHQVTAHRTGRRATLESFDYRRRALLELGRWRARRGPAPPDPAAPRDRRYPDRPDRPRRDGHRSARRRHRRFL